MLTQDDLKQIKNIVVSETGPLAKDLKDVRQDLNGVTNNLKDVTKDLKDVTKDLKDVKKRVRKIEKTTDVMIKVFDAEDVRLHRRIMKIEEHLGFTSKN